MFPLRLPRVRPAGIASFLLAGIAMLAVVAATGCCGPRGGAPERPNLLLISLDTLRADHLPMYGYHRETSPNLQRWADEGVVFERAVAQASSTLPSHRSLFQSRLASRFDPSAPMLAEVLADAGYTTAAFTGGGNVAATFGFGRGFEQYHESDDPHGTFAGVFPRFESFLRTEPRRPFFVFLHGYDIHHPYAPPEPWASGFIEPDTSAIDGPATGLLLNKVRRIHQFADFTGTVELSAGDRQRIVDLYDGGILFADTYVGRVQALLAELGLDRTTHVVVLSDHGEEFWEHGSVLHSFTVYQEMLHVPLILRLADGRFAGRRVSEPVRLLDVAPTLLHLAEVARPAAMEGHSVLPLLHGAAAPTTAIAEMHDLKSLLDPPWKLILGQDPVRAELYDLSTDPGETADLSSDEAGRTAELVQRLLDQLGDEATGRVSGSARERPSDPRLLEQLRALGYIE